MQGLVTNLTGEIEQIIKNFWVDLEHSFNIQAVQPLIPHFSWFGAEKFPEDDLKNLLEHKYKNKINFTVKCGGLAVFPGEEVIIYIPITVSKALINLHDEIYNQIVIPFEKKTTNLNPYYFPNNWVPHITLVQQKSKIKNFEELFQRALLLKSVYEFQANNIALIDSNKQIIFEIT